MSTIGKIMYAVFGAVVGVLWAPILGISALLGALLGAFEFWALAENDESIDQN